MQHYIVKNLKVKHKSLKCSTDHIWCCSKSTLSWLSVCPCRLVLLPPRCLNLLPAGAGGRSCPAAPEAAASCLLPAHPASCFRRTVQHWRTPSSCLWGRSRTPHGKSILRSEGERQQEVWVTMSDRINVLCYSVDFVNNLTIYTQCTRVWGCFF